MTYCPTTSDNTTRHGWLALGAALLVVSMLAVPASADDDRGAVLALGEDEGFPALVDDETVPAFARVRYVDDGARVVREAGYEEDLPFNAPVYQGDTVQTDARQRAELQLPDGALVRLDRATSLEVYSMTGAAAALSETTVLGLAYGAVQADVPSPRGGEAFRVDTPSASIYPLEPSALRVEADDRGDATVIVQSGRVEVSGARGSEILVAGEMTRVRSGSAPGSPWGAGAAVRDDFDRWVARRDDVYRLRERPGREYASLPDEVRPYYGELSSAGDWVYADDYGWAWVPRVASDWRPYTHGYWDPGPWGPVWVSYDPWGWPVYRYGRWDWSAGFGWMWLPGSVFRTSHVAWYYGPGYVGWCPLGYWNRPVYLSLSFGWGHHYFDHSPWVFVGYDSFYHRRAPYFWRPGRHRHASEVRRHLAAGRGVVTRTPIARSVENRSKPVRVRPSGLPADSFERARRVSERRAAVARRIDRSPSASAAGSTRTTVRDRISFRDEERQRLAADRPTVRQRAPRATSPDGSTRRPPAAAPRRDTPKTRPERDDGRRVAPRRTPPKRSAPSANVPSQRPVVRVYPGGAPESALPDRDRSSARDRAGGREAVAPRRTPPTARRPGSTSESSNTGRSRPPVAPRRSAASPRTRGETRAAEDSVRRFFGGIGSRSTTGPRDRSRGEREGRVVPSRTPRRAPGEARPAPSRTPRRPPTEARPAPSRTPRRPPSEARPAPSRTPRRPPSEARPAPSRTPRRPPSEARPKSSPPSGRSGSVKSSSSGRSSRSGGKAGRSRSSRGKKDLP